MIIRPKNWQKFQHYKHRKPPWIRLYSDLLDDYEFHCLQVASKALAPLLWLLASEYPEGVIDALPKKVAFRLHMAESDYLLALNGLINSGFIECLQDASNALATCKGNVITETETETETENKKILSGPEKSPDPIPEDSIPYQEIIEGMNQILESDFKNCDGTRKLIRARWNEGHRRNDFALVCLNMKSAWGTDPKMVGYLRPQTLFGTKFDSYRNQKVLPPKTGETYLMSQTKKAMAEFVESYKDAEQSAGGVYAIE